MSSTPQTVGKHMTHAPLCVERTAKLEDAHRMMREHGIRHLPVVEGERLVGIVSDRAIHFSRSLRTRNQDDILVQQAMTEDPVTYPSSTPLADVAQMMAQFRCGSALIVDDGKLVGIFTTVDALRALAEFASAREGARSDRAKAA